MANHVTAKRFHFLRSESGNAGNVAGCCGSYATDTILPCQGVKLILQRLSMCYRTSCDIPCGINLLPLFI